MKLFRLLQTTMPILVGYDVLEEFGIEAPNAFQQNLCRFTRLFGYVVFVSSTILTGGFLAFEATFEEFSETSFAFVTVLNDTFYFILLQWIYKDIFELNEAYEQMIEKRSISDEKREIYEKACRFVKKSSNYIYIGYVKVGVPITYAPYLFMSYFKYYTTNLDRDAFSLPFLIWTMFDWRTPRAYVIAFAFELFGAAFTTLIDSSLILHAIGSMRLLMAFIDDINVEFNSLDALMKSKKPAAELYEYLCEVIKFHSDVKQLATKFASTYALIFTSNLLWTSSAIAVLLVSLQIELTRPEFDSPAILKVLVFIFAAIMVFLVLCSACEELKSRFDDLDIYQRCSWYRYPAKIQRILPIITIGSQNADPFKIFGNITASRETCKRVIKGGFSTFMVLRSFLK